MSSGKARFPKHLAMPPVTGCSLGLIKEHFPEFKKANQGTQSFYSNYEQVVWFFWFACLVKDH